MDMFEVLVYQRNQPFGRQIQHNTEELGFCLISIFSSQETMTTDLIHNIKLRRAIQIASAENEEMQAWMNGSCWCTWANNLSPRRPLRGKYWRKVSLSIPENRNNQVIYQSLPSGNDEKAQFWNAGEVSENLAGGGRRK